MKSTSELVLQKFKKLLQEARNEESKKLFNPNVVTDHSEYLKIACKIQGYSNSLELLDEAQREIDKTILV